MLKDTHLFFCGCHQHLLKQLTSVVFNWTGSASHAAGPVAPVDGLGILLGHVRNLALEESGDLGRSLLLGQELQKKFLLEAVLVCDPAVGQAKLDDVRQGKELVSLDPG